MVLMRIIGDNNWENTKHMFTLFGIFHMKSNREFIISIGFYIDKAWDKQKSRPELHPPKRKQNYSNHNTKGCYVFSVGKSSRLYISLFVYIISTTFYSFWSTQSHVPCYLYLWNERKKGRKKIWYKLT